MALPLVASSIALFYAGAAFAYFVVFPLVFGFLTGIAPEGVAVMTDISAYLDFVLTLFFAFGLSFEVPIATIILVWMGMTTPKQLAAKRPYVIVGAFVLGMVLTPPDVISQTLLALPMWILFEIGVLFSKAFVRRRDDEAPDEDQPIPEPPPSPSGGGSPVAAEGPQGEFEDPDAFYAMTDEEMEAELDRIEADEAAEEKALRKEAAAADRKASIDAKLERVVILRDNMEFEAARRLLHEVLAEGDDVQVTVARNILAQLEEDE
jgi:sec-independent protein translocase protein TatC